MDRIPCSHPSRLAEDGEHLRMTAVVLRTDAAACPGTGTAKAPSKVLTDAPQFGIFPARPPRARPQGPVRPRNAPGRLFTCSARACLLLLQRPCCLSQHWPPAPKRRPAVARM